MNNANHILTNKRHTLAASFIMNAASQLDGAGIALGKDRTTKHEEMQILSLLKEASLKLTEAKSLLLNK